MRRAPVRLLHARHPGADQGADRQEGRRPHPRRRRPPPRRQPLPLHRLREDPRRGRAAGAGRRCRTARVGGIGTSGPRYEGPSSRSATPYFDDMTVPACCTALLLPSTPGPRSSHRHGAAAAPGCRGVSTAADIPGELRVGIIHTDWPVMIPVGGRTSYLGDVLAIVVADNRQAAREAAELVDVDYAAARRSPTPSPPSTTPRSPCGARIQRAQRSTYRAGRRRRRAGSQPAPRARGVPDPAHRARLPRTRVDAGPSPARRPGCTSTRAGRACGTTATRSPPCSAFDRPSVTVELVVQRRRVRRQGGHEQPGPDRAGRMAAGASRQVHPHA